MSLRNDLTVIVPIRGRRFYLPRIMNYYRDSPCDVIFLDSTEGDSYKDTDPTPNKYIHVPGKSYTHKLHDCLSSIKTKYSVVICDDDFLCFEEIDKCIEIVEKVGDETISFRGQSVALHEEYLSIESLDYFIRLELIPRVGREERIKRGFRYFNCSAVHNVMLTDIQIKIHKFFIDNPQYDAINYFGKLFAILAEYYGNNVTLPVLHMVKSSEAYNLPLKRREDVENTWKKHLSFSEDFLEGDLTTLAKFLDTTEDNIKSLHEDLISQQYVADSVVKVLSRNVLPKELHVSIYAPFTYLNHGQWGYRCIAGRINGRDLLIRLGFGGSLDGRTNTTKSFVNSKQKKPITEKHFSILYPSLHDKNILQLKKVIDYVDKFKREEDGTSVNVLYKPEKK